METTGLLLTFTVLEAELVHPFVSVIVTVYVVVAEGLTTTEEDVGPWLQTKELPVGALAVKVVDDPMQIVLVPEILTTGLGNMVTNLEAVAVQPVALVAVTIYVVATTGETVMDGVIAPVLHA
jgi:hypothetical protein